MPAKDRSRRRPPTSDELSESFETTFTGMVDRTTLELKISRRDTAGIYRELASAFRNRADQLDQEADAENDD